MQDKVPKNPESSSCKDKRKKKGLVIKATYPNNIIEHIKEMEKERPIISALFGG